MKIIAIAATDWSGAIGYKNQLIFHSKTDMQHFYRKTVGHVVLMGRKTFESIGKPLEQRVNIVLSQNPNFHPEGVTVFDSLQSFLDFYKDKDVTVFVIGGGSIYEQTKNLWSEIYLTIFNDFVKEKDTFFAKWYDRKKWLMESSERVKEGKLILDFFHYKKYPNGTTSVNIQTD